MKLKHIQIETISVGEDRQREDLGDIESLASSIRDMGLINPICVTSQGLLIAGERRLRAMERLGWSLVPCIIWEDLSKLEREKLELAENVKRKQLSWQEEAKAVARLHEIKEAEDPEWGLDETAALLHLSPSHVSRLVSVGDALWQGNDKISQADGLAAASNFLVRHKERFKQTMLDSLMEDAAPEESPTPEPESSPAPQVSSILEGSFHDWVATYSGPKFNVIHCDFPYGVNLHKSDQMQHEASSIYEDTPEIYFSLLETFCSSLDQFVSPAAHLIFWFSMNYYTPTYEALTKAGWRISPFPLIWHKTDNKGLLPDAQRGPRRIYETAFFGSRGDRKIIKPVGNTYGAPTSKSPARHVSEKPEPMLRHFMSMVVDDLASVCDPTAGSGSALRAAESLKAARTFGIELDPENADVARSELARARKLRELEE